MLLPKMLRRQLAGQDARLRIGFFLHIPFPASEIFQVLPWKRELLLGVLESDLIGLHTYDYASHFLKTCTRVLGMETKPQAVIVKDRLVAVGVFPIGIEPHKFEEQFKEKAVQDRIAELQQTFAGKKLIIGVDRLDYIKGIPHKIMGFEMLLKTHPEWQGKVVLLQVAVPSRTDVPEYQKLKREIDQLVGRVNGAYGSLIDSYTPVEYLFRSVDMKELTALYTVADCCLVTSLRDGMNLVCLEYVTCQASRSSDPQGPGTLVLSEFAGAAHSLCGGCTTINPWNTRETSEALNSVLLMNPEERRSKHALLYAYVMKFTARYWGDVFVAELKKLAPLQPFSVIGSPQMGKADSGNGVRSPFLGKPTQRAVINAFRGSKKRLIIFEYDGVLVPFGALPSLSRPPRKLLANLKALASKQNCYVYIFSGRDRKTLDAWFPASTGIGLSAEQGVFLRRPQGSWEQLLTNLDLAWRDTVRPLLDHYTIRTPGTFVEETEVQLVWHHRNAEEPFGSIQVRDLHHLLDEMPVSLDVRDKRLGVKPLDVSQSLAFRKVYSELKDLGFLLVVGDFSIGVDAMELPEQCFVYGIGKSTDAKWNLSDPDEVNDLLEELVNNKA
jgi:trehalose-phosphatase